MTFDQWFDKYHINASDEARTVARRVWQLKEAERKTMCDRLQKIHDRLERRAYPPMWKAWVMSEIQQILRGSR